MSWSYVANDPSRFFDLLFCSPHELENADYEALVDHAFYLFGFDFGNYAGTFEKVASKHQHLYSMYEMLYADFVKQRRLATSQANVAEQKKRTPHRFHANLQKTADQEEREFEEGEARNASKRQKLHEAVLYQEHSCHGYVDSNFAVVAGYLYSPKMGKHAFGNGHQGPNASTSTLPGNPVRQDSGSDSASGNNGLNPEASVFSPGGDSLRTTPPTPFLESPRSQQSDPFGKSKWYNRISDDEVSEFIHIADAATTDR